MKNIKIRNKILLLLLLCVFSVYTYAYSSLTSYKPKYGKLTANVNLRSIASTSSGKIRTLSKGTSVKMLGNLDNFYIVQLGTNEVGVLSKDYVSPITVTPKGALTYTSTSVKNMKSNANSVILRRGPGTNFTPNATLSKGTTVKSIGYIDSWYVVVTNSGQVGCIRKDLLSSGSTSTNVAPSTFVISDNEKIILDLINAARVRAGLAKLNTYSDLFKIARLKADDMVKNSYFSHTSPTYGSPFKMMSTYKISYKTAGENIAGNPSLEAAVNAWLNSETHKKNILSNSYNYIGIGVSKSDTYGYIIDAMFIRKIIH